MILYKILTFLIVLSATSQAKLFNIQTKPQEFRELLAVPLQTSIQHASSNSLLRVTKILNTAVDFINEHTLLVSATVKLNDGNQCTIDGNLSLLKSEMFDERVTCVRQYKLLYTGSEPVDKFQYFNVTRHFRTFWETFGASEAAMALDSGNYDITRRYKVFANNLIRVAWMNALERGSGLYGISPYSDLSYDEFSKFYSMPRHTIRNHLRSYQPNYQRATPNSIDDAPVAHDWRDHNAVTEVKNQGMCGSCWSFSTTGNIEGVHAVASGELISLSEQELVDCDTTDQGCNGGLMDNAFDQVEALGGLETEEDYKYTAHQGKCEFDKSKIAVKISGHHDVPVGDEEAMRDQLLETGPLAVALNAMWMQFYRGGVSHPWGKLCSPKMLDHGVLIVGYGVEPADPNHLPFPKKEQPYWIIKNSWGPNWGEEGYYRLYRGDGTCGIDQYVTTALPVAVPDPTPEPEPTQAPTQEPTQEPTVEPEPTEEPNF